MSAKTVIPAFVVEYFLLGKTRHDSLERFTQDAGIVTDVWLAFAKDRTKPVRVLIAPSQGVGVTAMMLASALHDAIVKYRRDPATGPVKSVRVNRRESPSVSPLENYVAATIYFDELLRIVLPMTQWWHKKSLSTLRRTAATSGPTLEQRLNHAILAKLRGTQADKEAELAGRREIQSETVANRRIVEAAPVAALIGVFMAANESSTLFPKDVSKIDPTRPDGEARFTNWVAKNAERIANAATQELGRQFEDSLADLQTQMQAQSVYPRRPPQAETVKEPPELIQRVFLDRKGAVADTDGLSVIKADAAARLFDVSCQTITWAVMDVGIAAQHPAFYDHPPGKRGPGDPPRLNLPSRVKAIYDFTALHLIRNFDLTLGKSAIENVVRELVRRRPWDPGLRERARKFLPKIAAQLEDKLQPDWNLVAQLIHVPPDIDDSQTLFSDHGTHVAGILGGDWRNEDDSSKLQGVCPDIRLYDLRVVDEEDRKATEFALLSAIEFVQFLNQREASTGFAVHGINISLSIPHEVRSYGCGATPVCVACDQLANTGVVVVAAAGNRGWNEQEIGFGNFVFSSITDPGNSREAITVGSTHPVKPHTFGISYFSSRGPTGDGRLKPDLVAPGEQIRGPIRGESEDELDGTSMAAPFVSGAAAMLLARHRELIGNPQRVKKILCESATDLGREKYFQGHGLVDVLRALQSV